MDCVGVLGGSLFYNRSKKNFKNQVLSSLRDKSFIDFKVLSTNNEPTC